MTTQIVEAFAKAGVVMPKAERVWHYLKDNPAQTVREMERKLHLKNLSGMMHYMVKAGIATQYKSVADVRAGRVPLVYSARGEKYVGEGLYPPPKKKTPVMREFAAPQVSSFVPLTPTPVPDMTINLDNLTIAEARNLYHQLKKMFA